ncbi:MAG: hypothetical protein V5A87_07010 [Candidatus Bipolaricaulota bacterium]|nr:hypothetical protein [Candidatus Bipolaricaulota bacterium]
MRGRSLTGRNYQAVFIIAFTLILICSAQLKVVAAGDFVRTETGREHEIYGFNQPRGPNQLIVYTTEYGQRTGTNPWGAEAMVKNGKVVEIRHGFLAQETDSQIPEDGFVLSGHGTAKEWLTSNLEKGSEVELIQKGRTKIGILVSGYNLDWYNQMGLESPDWAYFQEMKNLVQLVRDQGYKVVTFSDKDLEQAYQPTDELERKKFARLSEIKTLILPNTRRMSQKEVQNVRRYVQNGGTVLAIMQASYRDESDEKVRNGDYQLGNLLEVEFNSFSWEQGEHAYISKTKDHEIWRGLPNKIDNERGWAMVNSPKDGGNVLGVWNNSSREPSHSRDRNAAIVEGNRTIYLGEQLLTPENFESEEVKQLLGNTVKYLYNLEPSAGERSTARQESQAEAPDESEADQKSGGFDPVLLAGAGLVAAVAGYIFLF